jgi:hypothetical protein
MSEAEIKSLVLIAFVLMLAFGARVLWGKRGPRPSAKNGWRKDDSSNSGRFFDDQAAGGDPMAGGAD